MVIYSRNKGQIRPKHNPKYEVSKNKRKIGEYRKYFQKVDSGDFFSYLTNFSRDYTVENIIQLSTCEVFWDVAAKWVPEFWEDWFFPKGSKVVSTLVTSTNSEEPILICKWPEV